MTFNLISYVIILSHLNAYIHPYLSHCRVISHKIWHLLLHAILLPSALLCQYRTRSCTRMLTNFHYINLLC